MYSKIKPNKKVLTDLYIIMQGVVCLFTLKMYARKGVNCIIRAGDRFIIFLKMGKNTLFKQKKKFQLFNFNP